MGKHLYKAQVQLGKSKLNTTQKVEKVRNVLDSPLPKDVLDLILEKFEILKILTLRTLPLEKKGRGIEKKRNERKGKGRKGKKRKGKKRKEKESRMGRVGLQK